LSKINFIQIPIERSVYCLALILFCFFGNSVSADELPAKFQIRFIGAGHSGFSKGISCDFPSLTEVKEEETYSLDQVLRYCDVCLNQDEVAAKQKMDEEIYETSDICSDFSESCTEISKLSNLNIPLVYIPRGSAAVAGVLLSKNIPLLVYTEVTVTDGLCDKRFHFFDVIWGYGWTQKEGEDDVIRLNFVSRLDADYALTDILQEKEKEGKNYSRKIHFVMAITAKNNDKLRKEIVETVSSFVPFAVLPNFARLGAADKYKNVDKRTGPTGRPNYNNR